MLEAAGSILALILVQVILELVTDESASNFMPHLESKLKVEMRGSVKKDRWQICCVKEPLTGTGVMVTMSERLDALASTSKSRRDEREDMAGTAMVLEGTTEKSKRPVFIFYWMKLLISSTP